MATWADLFRRLEGLQTERDARALEERARQATVAAFEQWCSGAVDATMDTLFREAESRAALLEERTGARIAVECSERAVVFSSNAGEALRVVSLALAAARVYVYATRARSAPPYVHIATTRASRTRFPVLVSLPGCLVARAPGGDIELVDLRYGDRRRVSFDSILLRAFDLLLAGIERRPLEPPSSQCA